MLQSSQGSNRGTREPIFAVLGMKDGLELSDVHTYVVNGISEH